MQDEPWCIDAAREIRDLAWEVLDFIGIQAIADAEPRRATAVAG
jgi:hypothetical protein